MKKQFMQADMYGRHITLTYKGDDTYKTLYGAIITIFLCSFLLGYGLYKASILITRGDTTVSKKSMLVNLDEAGTYDPMSMGFDMALNFKPPLVKNIGNITLKHINYFYSN